MASTDEASIASSVVSDASDVPCSTGGSLRRPADILPSCNSMARGNFESYEMRKDRGHTETIDGGNIEGEAGGRKYGVASSHGFERRDAGDSSAESEISGGSEGSTVGSSGTSKPSKEKPPRRSSLDLFEERLRKRAEKGNIPEAESEQASLSVGSGKSGGGIEDADSKPSKEDGGNHVGGLKMPIGILEQQRSLKLGRVDEDVARTDNNDDFCISLAHQQLYPYSEHSSEGDEGGVISNNFGNNIQPSANEEPSLPTDDVYVDDDDATSALRPWAKRRTSPASNEVGALHVDDQAPQLNRRFFRGLSSSSRSDFASSRRMSRRSQARVGRQDDDNRVAQMEEGVIGDITEEAQVSAFGQVTPCRGDGIRGSRLTVSTLTASMATVPDALVEAGPQEPLVTTNKFEEDKGKAVVAEEMGFFKRRGRTIGAIMCAVVVALGVSLASVLVTRRKKLVQTEAPTVSEEPSEIPSLQPSMHPTPLPSHDPRPTLEIVQTRGRVQCGLHHQQNSKEGMNHKLCHAIAAVLLGDPDSIEIVIGYSHALNDRAVDVSLAGVSHTIEREVKEMTTGCGFAFSSPYYYDGMAYFGNETYVECAETERRYDVCSSLRICSFAEGSTGFEYVRSAFPSDFTNVGDFSKLWDGTCNVFAADRSVLLTEASSQENLKRGYIVGNKILSKEPISAMTRNDDYEFSNLINLIVNTLFYGEQKGLTRDSSLCGKATALTAKPADLNLLNAVHCVGNYGDIFGNQHRHIMNQVNNGTTGMLYAIPFGNFNTQPQYLASDGELLHDIRKQGTLNCGVVVPAGLAENITDSKGLVGMSRDYCHTLAAALFHGKAKTVNILTFPENDGSSFAALRDGTIDALAGGSSQWKHYLKISLSTIGFRFSIPYYYGNEHEDRGVSFFSMVTREEDVTFSLFIKCIVLSTMYAQEQRIDQEHSKEMPLVSFFGGRFNWALRDAISFSGNYNELYTKHFGNVLKADRGRNVLNINTGPQIHYLPDLDVMLQNISDGGLYK